MQRHYPLDPATGLENSTLVWSDGVPASGVEGSYPGHLLVTNLQDELLNVLAGAGITPNDGDLTQVWQAVQRNIPIGTAGGTANAITTTLSPAPAPLAWATLRLFLVKITANNTGSATIAPNGLTARTIKLPDGTTNLSSGALSSGGVALFLNDGTNVQLLGMLTGVGGTALSNQINILAGAANRQQSWSAAGTYTFTVPPANQPDGTTTIIVEVLGGGGAGGASGTGSGGGVAGNVGGGGGSGGYAIKVISGLTPGSTITIIVGAPGVASTFSAGGNGGSTSAGAYVTANGGNGGAYGNATYSTAGVGGNASGGDRNVKGQDGGASGSNSSTVTTSDIIRIYARGGTPPEGKGTATLSGTGSDGNGNGSGGTGASGGSGVAGGNGAPGFARIFW